MCVCMRVRVAKGLLHAGGPSRETGVVHEARGLRAVRCVRVCIYMRVYVCLDVRVFAGSSS